MRANAANRAVVRLASALVVLSFAALGRSAPSIAVTDARAIGVHPASAASVTRELYATAARLGYATVPESATRRAVLAAGPRVLYPADLLRIAEKTGAEHAIGAVVAAERGRYVVTLTLANADRTGPFFVTRTADAASLEATTEEMARVLLPAVPFDAGERARERTAPVRPTSSLRLALNTEAAFGVAQHPFENQIAGARLDYVFTEDASLGAFFGYANLQGKEGRVNNVLPYLQLEYRIHWSSTSPVRVPLRFAGGFLPKNGPYLRLAAGLAFPVGDTTRIGLDLIAPAIWVVENRVAASLNAGVEIGFDL